MTSKAELTEILAKYFANTKMSELCQDLLCIVSIDATDEFHAIISEELKVLVSDVPELSYTMRLFDLITIFARSRDNDRIDLNNALATAIAEVAFTRRTYYERKNNENTSFD